MNNFPTFCVFFLLLTFVRILSVELYMLYLKQYIKQIEPTQLKKVYPFYFKELRNNLLLMKNDFKFFDILINERITIQMNLSDLFLFW